MASPRMRFAALVTSGLVAAYVAMGGLGTKDGLKDKVEATTGAGNRHAHLDAAERGEDTPAAPVRAASTAIPKP